MPEQKSSIEKCPTCGTTMIKFDPPIEVELSASCGALKSGTYSSNEEVPICDLAKGHNGNHIHYLEKLIEWNNTDYINS